MTATGNRRVVRSLNLPQPGVSLIYKPLTKREKEELSKVDTQLAPVVVANK
jgi:hypothetical protein